jgi:hypothetical protein|tara:strand:- start:237 stop:419 length:183 start_codon:yes stop_codon:yes gene_type:complete
MGILNNFNEQPSNLSKKGQTPKVNLSNLDKLGKIFSKDVEASTLDLDNIAPKKYTDNLPK